LTSDYLNLKLANDRVQMKGVLPLEASKNGGATVSVNLHLRDGRTDGLSVRPSLRWSLTLIRRRSPRV